MVEFLGGLGVSIYNAMKVNVENQGAIALAKNPVVHDRLKRIDIQYHFTRGLVNAGRIGLDYVPTREMLADLLTKPLPRGRHEYLACGIGLVCSDSLCLDRSTLSDGVRWKACGPCAMIRARTVARTVVFF